MRKPLLLAVVLVSLAACTNGPAGPSVTLTPDRTASITPTTPEPTALFYHPPGWDGVADVACTDFDTQAHAQSFFTGTGGSISNDPYDLDGNHNELACESLP
jgi:hypothetical protein